MINVPLSNIDRDASLSGCDNMPDAPSGSIDGLADFAGLQPNSFIGPYCPLRLIGQGGMGEVWLAEQTTPVNRLVALKLIKAGMDTAELIARFQYERQTMALMDHPGIAKVLDAGSTSQGRSFFAMEYISGTAITSFCDERKMTIRERIELFALACDAVQHAHRKAVIHRDLKPSNILVSEVSGKPMPRVIDFGVAKAVAHRQAALTQVTRVGTVLGTPAYMSPEQANSEGFDVDTRTDVYSLGVVLYELLTGSQPLQMDHLPVEQMLRRLKEEDPVSPRAKLKLLGERLTRTSDNRKSDSKTLLRQFNSDLDAIVLKALEKDRSRRYGSPDELAADLGRYLRHEAVVAAAPSRSYRMRKLLRRFRTPIAIAAFCFLFLAAATIVSLWQRFEALQQRDRADTEAATTKAVNDFVQNDLLAQASTEAQGNLGAKADPDLKVRTVLDRAAVRIAGRFTHEPLVEAAIRDTIGQTYSNLGLATDARIQFQRALELRQKVLGVKNPTTLRTACAVATALGAEGNYQRAVAQLLAVLEEQNRTLGRDHQDSLLTEGQLGGLYRDQGNYQKAESIFRHQIERGNRSWGPEDSRTLIYLDRLADVCYRQGKNEEAEQLDRRVLDARLRHSGRDNLYTTISMSELALVYSARGQFGAAEQLESQVLEIRSRILGPESPATAAAMNNLAVTSSNLGRYAVAEQLDLRALTIRRRVLGVEHPETMMSMENLGCAYADLGKFSQAAATFRQAIAIDRRTMGIHSRLTLGTLSDEGFMFLRQGQFALAARDDGEVFDTFRQMLGSESAVTVDAATDLATAKVSEGKFAEALPLAREALAFDRKNRAESWQTYRAESVLGKALALQGADAEARKHLADGYEGMVARRQSISAENLYYFGLAKRWLNGLHESQ